ncbi:MAG: exopolysaccharide biosynthesis protein [Pseudooceanicola sp.]|nr:exopolysaccharide biosynthesis protein [Pseudooceanicola sp.]
MLTHLAAGLTGERITVAEIVARFGRRGHGALLLVFGAPNMLPLPLPGLSMLTGIPLILLTMQIALGRGVPWMPAFVGRRSFRAADFGRIAEAIAQRVRRAERMIRPRWPYLTEGVSRRLLGLLGIVLATALFLPLPFGNGLPGLALAVIGLALLERDGLLALLGTLLGFVGLGVTTLASALIAGGVTFVFNWWPF